MSKVRLRAPTGTDECNWSPAAKPYRVANDGTVWVDIEAVPALLAVGGFGLADPVSMQESTGTVRVFNERDPTATVTFGGQTYGPGPDGTVEVPIAALDAIAAHGFTVPAPVQQPQAAAADDSASRQAAM